MNQTLSALLGGVIDYAGLFPPAKLDMPDTLEHYLRYRNGSEHWIMNRLICPAARLPELLRQMDAHQTGELIPVSVIGTGGKDLDEWETNLETDARLMNDFQENVGERAEIEALEIRVPTQTNLEQYLNDLKAFEAIETYVELPWGTELAEGLAALAETEWIGAKARLGGLEASAYPSVESVAEFLKQSAELDLPFKLTAGLHHPYRHTHPQIGAKEHGFLNILVALSLNDAHELSRSEIAQILADEDPKSFSFTDEGLKWANLETDIETAEGVRDLFVGYGSCSIEEPLEDLRSLGYMNLEVR